MVSEGSDPRAGGSSTGSSGSVPIPGERRWPDRLREFSEELRNPPDDAARTAALGRTWKVLHAALSLYLRSHSTRFGPVAREDLEDLAGEKSLELLRRVVSGKTTFAGRSAAEIASFLSKVARNELLDRARRNARWADPPGEDLPEPEQRDPGATMSSSEFPDVRVQRREFVDALRQCITQLDRRSRLSWFCRVFYRMSSKDIAVHPDLGLKASHVDVLLQRARKTIRDCMRRRGFDAHDMPPGTFVEMWGALRRERTEVVT